MKLTLVSPLLLTFGLAACGGDDGVTPTIDAGSDAAGDIDAPDAPCTISTPNFGDKGALTADAIFVADMDTPALYKIAFQASLEAAPPADAFFFEIYTGYEPFGTQTNPTPAIAGTYQIAGNQLQYADCSICLTLASNAQADGSYDDDFMATGGTVTINEVGTGVGGNLNVTFSNLTFEQVTFDGATSIPVGNGCTTAISNATFTGVMMAPAKPQHAKQQSVKARGLLRR